VLDLGENVEGDCEEFVRGVKFLGELVRGDSFRGENIAGMDLGEILSSRCAFGGERLSLYSRCGCLIDDRFGLLTFLVGLGFGSTAKSSVINLGGVCVASEDCSSSGAPLPESFLVERNRCECV